MSSLGLLLVSLIWGTTFVAVKSALDDASPLLFLGFRFAIAAVLATLLLRKRPGLKRALWIGVPMGAVLALSYAAQTIGLVTTTPARSGFITGLNVVLIPFWGLLIVRDRPGLLPIVGLLIAVPGMWLLTSPGGGNWVVGDTWTLACAILFALHVVLLTRYGKSDDVFGLLFSQMLVTAVLCFGGALLLESPRLEWTASIWIALGITGVCASFLTTLMQLKLQPKVTPARVAIIFATEPVFAAIFSAIFHGERLGWIGWAGGGLILIGMLVSEFGGGVISGSKGEPKVT